MREAQKTQPSLRENWLNLDHAAELQAISRLLDDHPKIEGTRLASVLEDLAAKDARRRARARKEIQAMERLAFTRGVRVARVSRLGVLDTFAPEKTKYEVAARLAEMFPVLANQLPRKRNTWRPEEACMNVFDALGIAAATVERAR
jgi:hypothetical protein